MKPIGEAPRCARARVLSRALTLSCVMAVAIVTAGCATGIAGPFVRSPMHGMVYDGRNQPVALVTVQIDGGRPVASDVNGRFTVPGVRHGRRSIHAWKPGYRTVNETVEFVQRTQVLYVRILTADDLVDAAVSLLRAGRYTAAAELAIEATGIAADHQLGWFVAALASIGAGDPRTAIELLGWFREPASAAVERARLIAARAVAREPRDPGTADEHR